jgi:hypothetical protein
MIAGPVLAAGIRQVVVETALGVRFVATAARGEERR